MGEKIGSVDGDGLALDRLGAMTGLKDLPCYTHHYSTLLLIVDAGQLILIFYGQGRSIERQ